MTQPSTKPLFILVLAAALLQLFGHYFATHWLVFDSFLALWPIVRIILPVLLLCALAIPLSVLSLKRPAIDQKSLTILIFSAFALCCLAIYLANFADDYLSFYRKGASLEYLRQAQRFERFLIFTCSTLIAWEIFHRGFLLGALRYYLKEKLLVEQNVTNAIAILFVACFEALFHIKKPMYESMPLLFASIILSWLTIRTGSLWPALIIHLLIEIIFGYSAYVGW